MRVRRQGIPLNITKTVYATKRLPLWKLSDEMYLNRQLAPDPTAPWQQVKVHQQRMIEKVRQQQLKDMARFERELAGSRLPPTYKVSDLQPGMWLEGRVSLTKNYGVYVDIGAYNEDFEWVDGYLHIGQIREDGMHVPWNRMMDEVYLGERVRVRVREVIPATGKIELSMREAEDLPPLFFGSPRPYVIGDLTAGMKVRGIVRRTWHQYALVDIGADRLARIHVSTHHRMRTPEGFLNAKRHHRWAFSAFPTGAVMDFWVSRIFQEQAVFLSGYPPKPGGGIGSHGNRFAEPEREDGPGKGTDAGEALRAREGPNRQVRKTKWQLEAEARKKAEQENWDPDMPLVDAFLEDAMDPDDEMDSWVAQTEKELFEEEEEEEDFDDFDDLDDEDGEFGQDGFAQAGWPSFGDEGRGADDEDEEEFAEDEFAEDDFADGSFASGDPEKGFGPIAFSASELDGWVLEDEDTSKAETKDDASKLRLEDVEQIFDDEDDSWDGR